MQATSHPQVQQVQQVQCRECGMKHYATVCPICKEPTPHIAVLKGGAK